MARLPSGTIHSVCTAFEAAKTFVGANITNAKPAQVTVTGHGMLTGDVILIRSGWGRLNMRAFRITKVDADKFTLDGSDTTNQTWYAPGGGGGDYLQESTWQDLDRTLNHNSSGGDPKIVNVKFIESDVEIPLNDGFNAVSRTFEMDADMIGSPAYEAVKAISDTDALTIIRRVSKTGAMSLIPGKLSLSGEISLTEGQIETFTCSINAQNVSTNYPAP